MTIPIAPLALVRRSTNRRSTVRPPLRFESAFVSPGRLAAGAASIAPRLAPCSDATKGAISMAPAELRPQIGRVNRAPAMLAAIQGAISVICLSSCSGAPSPVLLSPMALETSARISAGMIRLGASSERSDCYADQIVAWLSESEQSDAVEIIEASTSKEDMRSGVLAAPNRVTQSFIRAHFGCSLYR